MTFLEHNFRPTDVGREAFKRPFDNQVDADCCRQMDDVVAPAYDIIDERFVKNRTEDELHIGAACVLAKVVVTACGEVVQNDDRVAPLDKRVDEVRANKSSSTRHQVSRHLPPFLEYGFDLPTTS